MSAAKQVRTIHDLMGRTIGEFIQHRELAHLHTNRRDRRRTSWGRDMATHNDPIPPSLPPLVYPRDHTEIENTMLKDAVCDHCNGSAAPTCDADAPCVAWDAMNLRIVCRDCVDTHRRCS